jgi:hypothetical protein
MERLRHLIKEILSTPPKKDSCNCGCHSCENVGNPGVILNESLVKKDILSENLRYHVDNQLPLTENTFRYGSEAFLNLWAEARYLYLREIIHVNDNDKEILLETDLGEYGIYEGKKVPLDMPMLEENEMGDWEDTWGIKGVIMDPATPIIAQLKKLAQEGNKKAAKIYDELIYAITPEEKQEILNKYFPERLNENAKNPPIGKPKRDSSGGKAYKVYVRDPKTKKIKTVRFGSGGLKAKINNPKARQAFAKRHRCSEKTDKTKASYWSCRLPRYAKLLGLKSSFSGFW